MTDLPATPPACPRHPDRTSYVRCTRCADPICPDCMIPAAVGFQCPDCVRAAAPPAPQTVAGGTLISRPILTYVLIALNGLIFLTQFLVGIEIMARLFGMSPIDIAKNAEWWRFASSAFLHGSLIHITFNMLVLFVIGPTLERILGHIRFAALYVFSALGGAVASYAFSNITTVSVGASGAIFGLMGALVIAGQRLRYDIRQVLILLAINIVIGFIAPNIDWRAHLGGLVTGALVAAIMVLPKREYRTLAQILGMTSLGIVLLLVAAWRTILIV